MSADYLDENIDCVPALGPAFSTDLNLTPEAGFLLSQVDGRMSWKELVLVLPFDRETVGRLAADLRRRDILVWEGGTPPPAVEAPATAPSETVAVPTPESSDDSASAKDATDPFGFGVSLPEGAPPPPAFPEPAPAPAAHSTAAQENGERELDDELDDDFDEAAEILEALRAGGVLSGADSPAAGSGAVDSRQEAVEELLDELSEVEALNETPNDREIAPEQSTPSGPVPESEDTAGVEELLDELIEIKALDETSADHAIAPEQSTPSGPAPNTDDAAEVEELLDELIEIEALDEIPNDRAITSEQSTPSGPVPDTGDTAEVEELLDELSETEALDETPNDRTIATKQSTPSGPVTATGDTAAVEESRDEPSEFTSPDATARKREVAPKRVPPSERAGGPAAPPRRPSAAAATYGKLASTPEDRVAQLEKQLALQRKLLERDDPFQALGVKGGASDEEVRDAWHRLSKRFHPDRFYGIDLPEHLAAELDDIYDRLKAAYERIATREKRREFLLTQKRARLARARAAEIDARGDDTDRPPNAVQTANPERLAELARAALDKRQYGAAINSYRMAHQLAPRAGYDRQAKLIELLQKLETRIEQMLIDDEPPLPEDVQAIESTLKKIDSILPDQAAFLRNCLEFLVRWSDDTELARSLVNRLLKLNRMPDTLTLAGQVYLKANLPRSALDYLEEARSKARDEQKARIRHLIKEARKQMK